jgi:multidrug efflux pump subunit AcrB
MNALTLFVIKHARFTWLIVLAIIVAGVSIYNTQPRQEDPEITLRGARVVTYFPGLPPERIEQLITKPIEEEVKKLEEVDTIDSISMTGMSIVMPEVHARYNDMDPIWSRLRNKMDDLSPRLPRGTNGPYVNDDYGSVSVVTLALTGDDFPMTDLSDVADNIRDDLVTLPLVSGVNLYGVQDEKIWIDFDGAMMSQLGLDPKAFIGALQTQNVILQGGSVEANGQSIIIQPSGELKSLDELKALSIKTQDDQLIYLQDVASIKRTYVDPIESPAFHNGKQAIVIGISMTEASNVVALGEQVTESLVSIRQDLPLGMELDIVIFQPDLVQDSVNSASVNLLQTVLVVLVVVMLFLGWRTGLIVGSMVPLTIMASLIGMSVWGIALHRVSIAAIIVALGLLVDNGVVVAEDIQKRMRSGASRLDAALETARSLSVPLLTSSLTTIAAFLPLMLIEGGSGEFLRSLGQVLAMALLGSWLLAITVIPAFCYWFLPDQDVINEDANDEDGSPDVLPTPLRIYKGFIELILRNRLIVLGLTILLLFSSFYIFSFVKQRSLGPSERNQFTVYLDLPSQATIDETVLVSNRLTTYLTDSTLNPEVTDVLSYVGSGGPRFFLALSPNDPQPNKGFMVVNTESAEQIEAVMERVNRFMVESLPEATGRTDILFLGPAPLGTVEMKITGPEAHTLQTLGAQVSDIFRSIPGSQSIRSDWENSVMKLRVDVDQERARRAGVTSEEVARTLSTYFGGETISTYREGDKSIPIALRAEESDRATLDRVRTVEIYSKERGHPVPLLQIADFRGEIEPSKIIRSNQQRALTIAGINPDMTAVEYYNLMQEKLDSISLPVGYAMEVEGEIKGSQESNKSLFKFAPHALFIILTLLILQFNSFRRTAIILITIPLVLIGANYGLFIFNAYFDFTAMLGLFSLAGIIINNGIVLIDRIEQQRATGMDVDPAIVEASLARVRPIFMTTLTTVVGLIPLALFGGEFWYGMAIVIMSGLGVGSLLTLGFVPLLYSLFFNLFPNRKNSAGEA